MHAPSSWSIFVPFSCTFKTILTKITFHLWNCLSNMEQLPGDKQSDDMQNITCIIFGRKFISLKTILIFIYNIIFSF